jgi:hypothetical protein
LRQPSQNGILGLRMSSKTRFGLKGCFQLLLVGRLAAPSQVDLPRQNDQRQLASQKGLTKPTCTHTEDTTVSAHAHQQKHLHHSTPRHSRLDGVSARASQSCPGLAPQNRMREQPPPLLEAHLRGKCFPGAIRKVLQDTIWVKGLLPAASGCFRQPSQNGVLGL